MTKPIHSPIPLNQDPETQPKLNEMPSSQLIDSFDSVGGCTDSFSSNPSLTEKKSSKLLTVFKAHKNAAGDATAATAGSLAPVIKHTANILKYSTHAAAAATQFAPIGSAVGASINLAKDGHTQKIVEERLKNIKLLYSQILQVHHPEGLPPLDSDKALHHFHLPAEHNRSVCEVMCHTLDFIIKKMSLRADSLKTQQAGSAIVLTGATLAAIGSAFFGIGALPGILTAAAGSIINLAPTTRAIGRATYKKITDCKGIDRISSVYFIWGLALHSAFKMVSSQELRDNPDATRAFCLADEWNYLRPPRDMKSAKLIAGLFLEHIGLATEDKTELASKAYFERLKQRLKSTANV